MKKTVLLIILSIISSISFGKIKTGAEQIEQYLPLLIGKRVGIVANHTSVIGSTHLIDTLHNLGINIVYIFAPEHGFRGIKSAGEHIKHEVDTKTGIEIFSLHGKTKYPSKTSLDNIDVFLFDLQDVGLRFYTYISTMHHIMSAAAIHNKEVIILDRPNPNGYYVDGPILDMKYKSFVGMYPIPVVYGMTIGELALMANGENWLENEKRCNLKIIKLKNYNRKNKYSLPIPPSPNLPNDIAIQLYANLCLFEATQVSIGRGTTHPFQQYGAPTIINSQYHFTPKSNEGAKHPIQEGKKCYGVLLSNISDDELYKGEFSLKYIIDAYNRLGNPKLFFNSFLNKLIGVDYVRDMILDGESAYAISKKWKKEVRIFKRKQKPYLLYKNY